MKLITPGAIRRGVAMTVLFAGGWIVAATNGCSRSPDAAAPAPAAQTIEEAGEGLVLSPQEVKALGIETSPVAMISHVPEAAGFGVVLAHEALAQSVADLTTAMAAQRQSESALERSKRLAGTPGALGADAQEAAQRQAIVDRTALELVRQRASTIWGQDPPWKGKGFSGELSDLARGQSKLVRVTFPLGAMGDEAPKSLRFARIGADQGRAGWRSTAVWAAPADANVPGTSFFALLTGSKVHEGERLAAWAPVGVAQSGVLIPAAAVVISNSKYWFYAQTKPHAFRRIELDTSMPTGDGYFIKQGLAAGEHVVTSSAGLLLARETGPSAAAE